MEIGNKNISKVWDKVLVARSANRINGENILHNVFDSFYELHGDRLYGDDKSIISGLALLDNYPVEKNFQPCVGKISKLSLPGGFGIRVDSGYRSGDYVTPYYDSLLLKLSCLAKDKTSAIKKMNLGLQELEIEGINTNIDFLKDIINDKRFLSGNYDEKFIELKMNNKY